MELVGRQVVVRPARPSDASPLATILAAPEVARWWGTWDEARVEHELLAPEENTDVLTIELDGRVIGSIQVYEEPDPEFRHAGLDLFLAPEVHGRGLALDAIRVVARHLIDQHGHHRLTIDPAADNAAAIRAYEKVGFRPVGRLRRYQQMPDGAWIDGLLMDLLADELVE